MVEAVVLEEKVCEEKKGIMIWTHYEDTGMRIYHKKIPCKKNFDIIIIRIDKNNKEVYFEFNTCIGKTNLTLPIKYLEPSDYIIDSDPENQTFFGIQAWQGQDREDEIKIGYRFPKEYRIQKGYFLFDYFIEDRGFYFVNPKNLENLRFIENEK